MKSTIDGNLQTGMYRWMAAGMAGFLMLGCTPGAGTNITDSTGDWREYEGGPQGLRYSPLDQINQTNVATLQPAWTYYTGDATDTFSNPLIVEGVMYVVAKDGNKIVALDAETGKELWSSKYGVGDWSPRSLTLWTSENGKEKRLLFFNENHLLAIDAANGELLSTFGTNGRVDLRQGLERDPAKLTRVQSNTPGRLFGNLIIVGSSLGDDYDAPAGDVRAYDVRTGKLAWTFHTIPAPGEPGAETWPKDARKNNGGVNAWGSISIDRERGIVYLPIAAPNYDFFGADRSGDNLYSDSLVALDARTGRRIWHYQIVHHDLWDYDAASAPMLLTVKHDGKPVDIVALAGKTGFLYVFDRVTGKPLWPIEERPVPQSRMPGEKTSPTQPFPTWPKPFARQSFTEADIDPKLPADERALFVARLRKARNEGLFTPPGLEDAVEMPGNHGGNNVGMSAGDPKNGLMFVASFDIPALLKLDQGLSSLFFSDVGLPAGSGPRLYAQNCASCHGANREGQPPAVPTLKGIGARMPVERIRNTIRSGRMTMPSFGALSEQNMTDLVNFLRNDREIPVLAVSSDTRPKDVKGPIRYKTSFGFLLSAAQNPIIAPPWMSVTGYDLNTGAILWQRPLGADVSDLRGGEVTGIPFVKPGMAASGGGLLFVSTSRDRALHALDSKTGKILWQGKLPGPPQGGISIYSVKGRQYVVVPAASQNFLGANPNRTPARNAYVAFALPTEKK